MTKTGRGRQLPLPAQVQDASRDYVKIRPFPERPYDHVFCGIPRRSGYPCRERIKIDGCVLLTSAVLFPFNLVGDTPTAPHFCFRLHQRGVGHETHVLDLLGHRH